MVLSINSVGFSFIDDPPFVEEVIPIFESDDLLLFVRVRRLAHRGHAVAAEAVRRARVTDHVVGEVYHGGPELLCGYLLAGSGLARDLGRLLGSQLL